MSSMRIAWLRLLWFVFRWPSVVLVDFDGKMNARLLRGAAHIPLAHRYGFGVSVVRLLPNGRTRGAGYVNSWEPLFPPVVAETDANAPDDARLVSGATLNPVSQPPESGAR